MIPAIGNFCRGSTLRILKVKDQRKSQIKRSYWSSAKFWTQVVYKSKVCQNEAVLMGHQNLGKLPTDLGSSHSKKYSQF